MCGALPGLLDLRMKGVRLASSCAQFVWHGMALTACQEAPATGPLGGLQARDLLPALPFLTPMFFLASCHASGGTHHLPPPASVVAASTCTWRYCRFAKSPPPPHTQLPLVLARGAAPYFPPTGQARGSLHAPGSTSSITMLACASCCSQEGDPTTLRYALGMSADFACAPCRCRTPHSVTPLGHQGVWPCPPADHTLG